MASVNPIYLFSDASIKIYGHQGVLCCNGNTIALKLTLWAHAKYFCSHSVTKFHAAQKANLSKGAKVIVTF